MARQTARTPDLESNFLEIVAAAQEATLDLGKWNKVTALVARALGGHSGALYLHDFQHNQMRVVDSWRLNPDTVDSYREHYYDLDDWYKSIKPLPIGAITLGNAIVPRTRLVLGEFYNDILSPNDIQDLLGMALVRSKQFLGQLSVYYHSEMESVAPSRQRFATKLVPILHNALLTSIRLQDLEAQLHETRFALDQVSHGIVTVDSHARLLDANQAARRIMGADDGLSQRDAYMTATAHADNVKLKAAVNAAIDDPDTDAVAMCSMLIVSRPSGKRPYSLIVRPIAREDDLWGSSRAVCAIHITDPEDAPRPSAEWLREVFNLTPAEARLAVALGIGSSVNDYAEQSALSINTVRWTLKQVLSKTDCRRQSDLVRLMANMTLMNPNELP